MVILRITRGMHPNSANTATGGRLTWEAIVLISCLTARMQSTQHLKRYMKSFLEQTNEERLAEYEANRLPKHIREKKGKFKVKRVYESEYDAVIFDPTEKPWPSHNVIQASTEGKINDCYFAFIDCNTTVSVSPGDLILLDSMGNVKVVVNANHPWCKIELIEELPPASGGGACALPEDPEAEPQGFTDEENIAMSLDAAQAMLPDGYQIVKKNGTT